MKKVLATSLSILALVLTSNLQAQKKKPTHKNGATTEILNKKWIPTEILGEKVRTAPNSHRNLSLEFLSKDKRYVAHTDCNTISGPFSLKEKKLKMSDGMSTMMACKDAKYEGLMNLALDKVDHFTVKSNTLTLFDSNNKPVGVFILEK